MRFNHALNWCWKDSGGYGGHFWYTANALCCGPDGNFATWRPNLTAASSYSVCVYIPNDKAYTHQARYMVHDANGVTQVNVNQQPLSGWTSLGVFPFNAGAGGYLYLGDQTGAAGWTEEIGFDAAEWVPNGGGC
jgi:hypothetical protein